MLRPSSYTLWANNIFGLDWSKTSQRFKKKKVETLFIAESSRWQNKFQALPAERRKAQTDFLYENIIMLYIIVCGLRLVSLLLSCYWYVQVGLLRKHSSLSHFSGSIFQEQRMISINAWLCNTHKIIRFSKIYNGKGEIDQILLYKTWIFKITN